MVNDTVTFMPAPMRPLLAARPDAYRKVVDISLWQKATDRNDVFDTNLIPEASAGPLSVCRTVWIITQADPSRPAHEQNTLMDRVRSRRHPCVLGATRPRLLASRALAVQPGPGHQGDAINAEAPTRRGCSR